LTPCRFLLPRIGGAAIILNMARTTQQLEARLTRVEQELAELKAALPKKPTEPWYRRILGDFSGDDAYRKIIHLG
jgi:hypothetical protein